MTVVALLPVHLLKIKWLLRPFTDLTRFEYVFLSEISGRRLLSERQVDKLNQIYDGVRHGRQLCFADEHETWDNVHCFDRV